MEAPTLIARNNAHPKWWKDPGLKKLNWHLAIIQMGAIVGGYDGSLMNGFFAIPDYLADMGDPDANVQGLLIAAISLGTMIGLAIAGTFSDKLGRKKPQLIGCILIIIGSFVQAFAVGRWEFFGSRLIVGTGLGSIIIAGSCHCLELAHPRQSAIHTALFGANYFIGAILSSWLCFGSLWISSNWNWRMPTLVQGVISIVQFIGLIWVPESPRWLVAQGRVEEAHEILAKYHSNGVKDDELVLREINEIQAGIEVALEEKSDSIFNFFSTPGNRKRLVLLVYVGLIIQWCGNGIISYYLAPILESSGISSSVQQQGINGGLQIWSYAWALYAAFTCNRYKRRTLWLASFGGMLVSYIIFTSLNATFNKTGNKAVGSASIPFLFTFNASYSLAATALCYLYCLEILPQGMRAKGMAISLFIDYGAIFFNQYVNPIALEALNWKYFLLYIAILAVSVVFIWWYFPETYGLSVEEAAMVCDGEAAREKLTRMALDRMVEGKFDEKGLEVVEDIRAAPGYQLEEH